MLKALRIFFRTEGANPWITVLCLLAAGIAEGLSIAMLLPILTLAQGDTLASSPLGRYVGGLLGGVSFEVAITGLLVLVVAGIGLKSALTYLAMRYVGYSVAEVSTRLRTRIIKQLLEVRWSYLVSQRSGRFLHVANSQVNGAVQAFQAAAAFAAAVLQTSALMLVAVVVSWKMALAATAMGGLIFLLLRRYIVGARRAGKKHSQRNRELVQFMVEALNNMKPVKAMGRDAGFVRIVEEKIRYLRKSARKQVMTKETLKNLEEVIATLFLASGLYFALIVLKVPVADMLVVAVILMRTVRMISRVQQQYQLVVSLEAPFEEIQELLDETAEARESQGGSEQVRFSRELRFESVSFAYDARPVLSRLDLTIPYGKLVVITGPSGVGKTTLLDLVLGLYHPTEGRILIDGIPLPNLNLVHWRRQIGYVAQELILLHDTVAANVSLGDPAIDRAAIGRALELAGAGGFVAELPQGIDTVVGDKGSRLSGGQRQRIALARALVGGPRLLILDEVTSALDPESEREIIANIRTLAGDTTILAITHRPAFLDWADMVHHLTPAAGSAQVPALAVEPVPA
jgi:ATP-binding cassette subfamily C protein